MRSYSRFAVAAPALAFLAAALLASCGQSGAPESDPQTAPATGVVTIRPGEVALLCDAINEPTIFTATEPDATGVFVVREYSKTNNGDLARTQRARWGEEEGSAGSRVRAINDENGVMIATVLWLNEGMLDDASAAYTPPLVRVQTADSPEARGASLDCRWYARTRVIGFTGQRSFVVVEDADGDLIYRSFDFSNAARAQRVELDGAQRTTTFNVEVRDGREMTRPDVTQFEFDNQGITYRVFTAANAPPALSVLRGETITQSDTITAYQAPPAVAE